MREFRITRTQKCISYVHRDIRRHRHLYCRYRFCDVMTIKALECEQKTGVVSKAQKAYKIRPTKRWKYYAFLSRKNDINSAILRLKIICGISPLLGLFVVGHKTSRIHACLHWACRPPPPGEWLCNKRVTIPFTDYGGSIGRANNFYRATAMLSAVYAVVVCLCVCVSLSVCLCVCHTPVLYQNG